MAQASPAARHPASGMAAQRPATQLPPQQSRDVEHAAPTAAQLPAAHVVVAASHASPQHAPARAQG